MYYIYIIIIFKKYSNGENKEERNKENPNLTNDIMSRKEE